ncbi:MAG: hypothetical protein WC907_00490 [Acholeplasmataceae bacterium]
MESTYKKWLQNEYYKQKKPTLNALRSLSVDDLLIHIRDYRDFIVSLVDDNEKIIKDANLERFIEKQLKQIDDLELLLSKGIDNSLINIMFDEEKIIHMINKSKKNQQEGASCKTSID